MRRRARAGAVAIAAALSLLTSGCVAQGLAFRVDDRLTFEAPKDRSEVTLPLTVRWSIKDFHVVAPGSAATGDGKTGYFGIFVDGAPQPPGKPLAWIARKDRSCRPADGCPDAEFLAARNVYSTSDTSIRFEQLPRPTNTTHKERHSITVILLDPTGHRLGESAFQLNVTVKRAGG